MRDPNSEALAVFAMGLPIVSALAVTILMLSSGGRPAALTEVTL